MKFRITNKDGQSVAEYDNYSEVETFLNHSMPDWGEHVQAKHDDHNFDVMDAEGRVAFRVAGQTDGLQPREPQPAAKKGRGNK